MRCRLRQCYAGSPPRRILGNRVFRYCEPGESLGRRCRGVEAVPFDRERGYVNAVGRIEVQTPVGIEASTFSPLGEAIFLEYEEPYAPFEALARD